MKKIAIILIGMSLSLLSLAQVAPQKYFIEFTDKNDSPFSINRPEEFLSPRALERRQNQGILIDQNDIPVNENYINSIKNLGVTILTRSKWFNGITIYCVNHELMDSILRFPFVKSVTKSIELNNSKPDDKFKIDEVLDEVKQLSGTNDMFEVSTSFNYGQSYRQIHMLNGDSMHRMGYRGEGKIIAVLDAGFYKADVLPAFDSLWENNQILGTKDFVNPGNNVFLEYEHGMEVLSVMGGNIPGQLIGTAPKAQYWLLRTEEKASENIIEEYNWVSAAEFADSAGVDIINSSLGYTTFDDTTQSHQCSDMDGNTTPVTKGANLAASKGMIIVNSAGNSGGSSWKCISAPADGFYVLAIASVDSNGIRSSFSSTGESTVRIKPNVAAMGSFTVLSSSIGTIVRRSGTSFSSPLIAGMTACLWQAAPAWSNSLIMRAIELSSSQISNPDSLLGYGIPDFPKALQKLSVENPENPEAIVFPNPFTTVFKVILESENVKDMTLQIFDQLGRLKYERQNISFKAGERGYIVNNVEDLPAGNYILRLSTISTIQTAKLVKLPL
ncbi:MAG: S8 family serine peptidase [Bacteroidales bacterium]|nr:S8 family serine peptidase [Bacteroidales bacterium]